MTTTADRFKTRRRAVHTVEIDGGDPLYVRDLTLAELREIDRRAEQLPAGQEREIRRVELMAVFALAEASGAAMFPDRTAEDLDAVAWLTAAELRAVAEAAVPGKDAAKND